MALAPDIQQQVFDLLSRASNISFVTSDVDSRSLGQLIPGQKVVAEILSLLPNNRVQVSVGIDRFNLDLPMPVRVGQSLELIFVSADPRSTFAIAPQTETPPSVKLSDASRLLSSLVSEEELLTPQFRSSLQSISQLLRGSSGETAVLSNILDEALIYASPGNLKESKLSLQRAGNGVSADLKSEQLSPDPDKSRLAAFKTNASILLENVAQSSRYIMLETTNNPVNSIPLVQGEEIDAVVVGVLSGGRVVVEVAGSALELLIPLKVASGDILRLTYISGDQKPIFAMARRADDGSTPSLLSDAGRWLSVLEHSKSGMSVQQSFVLERLNTVLRSLPLDSPLFGAISDEAMVYRNTPQPPPDSRFSAVSMKEVMVQKENVSGNGILLSNDMAKLLQAVISGNRLAFIESLNRQNTSTFFLPGQQLKGEVISTLGGGRFAVQVAGKTFEFIMPKGVKSGDVVNLFFVAEEPSQTFLMLRAGAPVGAKVSETGRWLSTFWGETSSQLPAQTVFGILHTLLAGPTSDATLLSEMLHKGLRESGLFYESHLARWFGGEFQLGDILKEPQGLLSPCFRATGEQKSLFADAIAHVAVRSGSAEIMEAIFKQAGKSQAHEGIADQRSLPIVAEQLSVLQNGQLLLSGDLFPGQRMDWTVAERRNGRNSSGGRESSWESGVTVNLPNMGEVTAKLTLDGTRIAVKLIAVRNETVTILESGRERLTEQLEGAGLTPTEMSIKYVAS
ncbi:MAG: flagellar hook-length control protein FliK [Desulfuromonadaceae bacterium]|nr:flagellar hook-length control protein FliK [Desulfuromonadaceae bacterium]MDD2855541.1 flagellar hook-length control protein FliK [Desulfuromonadaceae bacterium]